MDVFASFGYTHAKFADGTSAGGVDVSDKKIPFTPDFTALFGAQLSRALNSSVTLYGRGEFVMSGDFEYDEANTARQEAYNLANFRFGGRGKWLFAEGWIRNAFDTMYVPIAISLEENSVVAL